MPVARESAPIESHAPTSLFPVLFRHRASAPGTILPQASPKPRHNVRAAGERAPPGGPDPGTRVRLVDSSYCGRITESMTWMTPFEASTSALTTLAPLTLTPSDVSILTDLALDRLRLLQLVDVGGHHLAGDDVIGEHLRELRLVGDQGVEVRLGDLRERLVRRGEDGERAGPLERVHEASGLERGRERLEAAGGDARCRRCPCALPARTAAGATTTARAAATTSMRFSILSSPRMDDSGRPISRPHPTARARRGGFGTAPAAPGFVSAFWDAVRERGELVLSRL